jgi:DNA-binding transcriptional LysR family regulator
MTRILDWEGRIGRRLKLRDLHILFAVVQWGSMVKAAKHLGMSQPAVSEAVANLEDALRVRLLDRSTKGITPTIYANALLKRGAAAFDELKQGVKDIEFLANPAVGDVRIGCPESLMAGFVPAIIAQLSRRHPKVSVQVVAAQPGEQEFHELRDRSVDLLVGRIFRPLETDEIDAEILCEDAFAVVAGAQSKWARLRKVALADLVNEPWICFPANSVANSYIEDAFRVGGLELPRPSITTFSTQMRLHLLSTGQFLTFLHRSVLRFNARARSLKILPIELSARPVPVAVFTLRNRTLSPVVQLFIDHAHQVADRWLPRAAASRH